MDLDSSFFGGSDRILFCHSAKMRYIYVEKHGI